MENRREYERKGLRYPSDLTDAEWALVEPLIPPAKRGGRKREVNVREVLDGIFSVLSTGCQWRALPPKSTVHDYLQLWDSARLRLHHALYVQARELAGRETSPSAAIIDSQSVKGGEKGAHGSIRQAMMRASARRGRAAARSKARRATSWLTRSA